MKASRCLIISPLAHAATIAFFQEFLSHLQKTGWEIHLIQCANSVPLYNEFVSSKLTTLYFDDSGFKRNFKLGIAREVKNLKALKFGFVAGLSQYGLAYAYLAGLYFKCPAIYLNDELWESRSERGGLYSIKAYLIKWLEVFFSRRSALVVTQDEERAVVLQDLNGLGKDKIWLVPNVPSLEWSTLKPRQLLEKELITLQSIGSAPHADIVEELMKGISMMPKDVYVEFQRPRDIEDSHYRSIVEQSGRAKLLTQVFKTSAEFHQYVGTADIGLVLYKRATKNRNLMGKASGKLNTYLIHGIPCIVTRLDGLKWLDRYGAVRFIDSFDELPLAMKYVRDHYAQMSLGCIDASTQELDISKALAELMSFFDYDLT